MICWAWLCSACVPTEEAAFRLQGRLAGFSLREQNALGALRWRLSERRHLSLETVAPAGLQAQDQLHETGLVALVVNDLDRAVSSLVRASEQQPENAAIANDLAVARLERAWKHKDARDVFFALSAARRAIRLDPDLQPARFNSALALGRLALFDAAHEGWMHYLHHETDSRWRRQGRHHRDALPRRAHRPGEEELVERFVRAVTEREQAKAEETVAASPWVFRKYAETRLFPRWGTEHHPSRGPADQRRLTELRVIGDVLARQQEDRTISSTVAQIEALREDGGPRLHLLAQGLSDYSAGVTLAEKGAFGAALEQFRAAELSLTKAESPLAGWSAFRRAVCHYQKFAYERAKTLLRFAVRYGARAEQPVLRGRAHLLLSSIYLIEGDPSASLSSSAHAIRDLQPRGENVHAARALAMHAFGVDYLGKSDEAWQWLHAALRELGDLDHFLARTAVLLCGVTLAMAEREPDLALFLQEESLRVARLSGRPMAVPENLRMRAAILQDLGRKKEAQEDLREASEWTAALGPQDLARSVEADRLLVESEIQRELAPEESLAKIHDAIEIFRATSNNYRLAIALHRRAQLHATLGRLGEAERDLSQALAETERQRGSIAESRDRIAYFDQRREMVDAMIELQLDHLHRPLQALAFGERAKARVLEDWMVHQPGLDLVAPSELTPNQELAPISEHRAIATDERTIALVYSVLFDRVIVWVLRRDAEVEVVEISLGVKSLTSLCDQLRFAFIEGDDRAARKISASLFEHLIQPLAGLIKPGDSLIVVPDGPLHSVPFSLLQKADSGRLVLHDHQIILAPSLSIYTRSLQRDHALTSWSKSRALLVVEPKLSRGRYSLGDLSAGETETRIADVLKGSKVLRAENATKERFLQQARHFDILHFGGHSVLNLRFPLLSQMIFSATGEEPGSDVLYAKDLLKLRLVRTRLVVLASCNSASGKLSRTEGVESLARPFLAAGASAVIASLWPVDDQDTADFFLRFYQLLSQSTDLAKALQATQLEFLENFPEKVQTWGAFVLMGASSTRPSM